MPGIIYHLSFAQEVMKNINNHKINLDKKCFLSGNLIPDLAINKNLSHYRMEGTEKGFLVPNLEIAKKDLLVKDEHIKLGMYAHLYLDYQFIENYLIKEFIFDKENMVVINTSNGFSWNAESFFAKPNEGGILYKGYNEVNKKMIENSNINLEEIYMLPQNFPQTGIYFFDERHKKSWKDELNSYLKEDITYSGEILNYTKLWKNIVAFAKKFVEYEL